MPPKQEETKRCIIKVDLGGEIHRQPFAFSQDSDSLYPALVRHVQKKIGANRAFSLGYHDADNDFVTISSALDLQEAIVHVQPSTLKVVVTEHNYDILQLEDVDSTRSPPITPPTAIPSGGKDDARARKVATPPPEYNQLVHSKYIIELKKTTTQIADLELKLAVMSAELEALKTSKSIEPPTVTSSKKSNHAS
jgi:hypothetical protein